MKTKTDFKENKTSAVLLLSLALATVMFINAGIIPVNVTAGNNNFSTTPANGNNIIEPVPTPTPRANKRSGEKAGNNDETTCLINCQKAYEKAMQSCSRYKGQKQVSCKERALKASTKCSGTCSDN